MIDPAVRGLFEIPDGVAYLNCAYMSPSARPVVRAGEEAVARKARPWEILADDFFADSERLRGRFAALVGGDADGVAIVPAVSYGVGVAAANLPLARGERVLFLAEEFPSALYAWRVAADAAGAQVAIVERPADDDWTAAVLDRIDDRTAVVAVPNCHWTDGTLVDLVRVGAAARAAGAALVVDATQSLGARPFDLAAIRPDVLVAAGYKWLLGPYGLGYLWVAPEHRGGRPLEQTWIGRAGSEDFAALVDYRDEYQPGARRYDVGERSSFALVPMALAALDLLLGWGVDEVEAHTAASTAAIAEAAASLGFRTAPPARRALHLMGLRHPDGLPAGVAGSLAGRDVHVSQRGDSIRVSPHVYTTPRDVERLAEGLGAVLHSGRDRARPKTGARAARSRGV